MSVADNNKRIAKNTLYLYFRMFFTMAVGLYTSRVVLNTLGVSDYGIYNVMGGIIGMLTYVNQLLSGATARFLTIDLGKGDIIQLKKTFSIANTLALAAVVIILFLGETIGLWFMNNFLNIEPARIGAANWVYQCALISCCVTVLQNPYSASIISHEKMNIYAYMSIFDVVMKLFIVFILKWFGVDKLKLYAALMFVVTFITAAIYRTICSHCFKECRFSLEFDTKRFKEMMTYSGWNMVGAFANVLNNYGLNILLNIFFGTIVNAARGIALQVSHIVQQFYSNFQTASRPQVFKYYAQGDLEEMRYLICNTSRYGAYLLLCLIIPIAFNIDDFLNIWLGQQPEYTAWFTRVILLQILFQAIDLPIGMGIHAVGKMRLPNLTSAFFYLCVFPITFIVFKLGFSPIAGYCVYLAFAPFIMVADILILKKYCGFSVKYFIFKVLLPIGLIATISSAVSYFIARAITQEGFWFFIIRSGISFFSVCFSVMYIGIPKQMRRTIVLAIKRKLLK